MNLSLKFQIPGIFRTVKDNNKNIADYIKHCKIESTWWQVKLKTSNETSGQKPFRVKLR